MNMFDALVLALLGACVVVWPTQVISDAANRWLRGVTIVAVIAHLAIEGLRVPLLPAYLIAVLFALLLLLDRRRGDDEPSSIRESKESGKKTAVRWLLIAGSGAAVLTSVALLLLTDL